MSENQIVSTLKNRSKIICDSYMEEMRRKYGSKDYAYWNGLEKGYELALKELSKIFNTNIG